MPDLYLTYSSMDAAAADIATVKEDLVTLLADVRSEVDSLGADFHTQTASSSYESAVTTFVTSMTEAVNGLENLSRFLTGTVDTFTALDTKLAQGIEG